MIGIGAGVSTSERLVVDNDDTDAEIVSLRNDRAPTIVLIERRTLIRDCLSRCISDGFGAPVISFPTVDSLQEASAGLRPALIIVSDWRCIDERADCVIGRLRRADYDAPIVVLSDAENLDDVAESLRSGANGHVTTGTALQVAIEALRLVLVGGVFVPGDSVLGLRQACQKLEASAAGKITFTARQNAVLDALRQGKTNKLIAYELKMSESTVKVHVSNIMKKLGAKNRTEVAVKIGDSYGRAQNVA